MNRSLSVFSVSEYRFCKRAGIIAANQAKEEDDDTEDLRWIPTLTYSPCFTIADLRAQLKRVEKDLHFLAASMGIATVFGLGLFIFEAYLHLVLFIISFSISYLALLLKAQRFAKLKEEIKTAEEANTIDLKNFKWRDNEVSWWNLLKSDWVTSSSRSESIFHQGLSLAGKPAKILSNGNEIIPVIIRRQDPCEVQENHRLRLAYYAELLENSERRIAKWGLLLFAKTKMGILIPIDDSLKTKARNVLSDFRRDLESNVTPNRPYASKCSGCPWGKPISDGADSLKEPKEERWTKARSGTSFRSPCGDHYDWIPPHNSAYGLRLIERPQPLRNDDDYDDD